MSESNYPPVPNPNQPESSNDQLPVTETMESPAIQTESAIEKPTWLHPTSLMFELGSHFWQFAIPAGIALFSAAQGSKTGLYFAVAFFVPAVFVSIFRYFTLRYRISNGELVVKSGLIFRRVRTVPITRIQNLDLVQNVVHRIFRVAEVRIETASGTEAEATLRVLSMKKVNILRSEIFSKTHLVSGAGPANKLAVDAVTGEHSVDHGSSLAPEATDKGISLVEIPTGWLLKAGLASNRGLIIIGVLFGAWFQFDLESKIDMQELQRWLPAVDGSIYSVITIASLVFAVLLVLRVLGIVWFLLRFHGYRLRRHGEDLRISCGLLTKVSATVPRNRIQFISVHQPIVMKWFGLVSIRIETAGGGGMAGGGQNATTSVSRRWFIPVLDQKRVPELLEILRPSLTWQPDSLHWQPLAERAGIRMKRLAVIPAIVVGAAFCFFFPPWGWIAGPITLPFWVWYAGKRSKAMKYARRDDYVVYRSGILIKKTSVTFFDKVQVVHVAQSPFDRRWNMATLSVDTAAAGSAEHQITIRFLDEAFARNEYSVIADASSRRQPDFG